MNILITGKNGYIGLHMKEWIAYRHKDWYVAMLDVKNEEWKSYDFSSTDVIIHLAGIVHQPKNTDRSLYEKVNIELTHELASTAKSQGVKQFIFFSSMAVYGKRKELRPNIITLDTPLEPQELYGETKLEAERKISLLSEEEYTVSIVRPPNVYGKGCKGGYISGFTSIVNTIPILPKAYEDCKQSLIYIDNLCEFVVQLIEKKKAGVYMPQDDQSVSAVELMAAIANGIDKKVYFSRILGNIIKLLHFLPLVQKAYGGIEYDSSLSTFDDLEYIEVSFEEAILRTVKVISHSNCNL